MTTDHPAIAANAASNRSLLWLHCRVRLDLANVPPRGFCGKALSVFAAVILGTDPVHQALRGKGKAASLHGSGRIRQFIDFLKYGLKI
jgi:hypothetical protein